MVRFTSQHENQDRRGFSDRNPSIRIRSWGSNLQNIEVFTATEKTSKKIRIGRLLVLLLGALGAVAVASNAGLPANIEAQNLNAVLKEFQGRLHISQPVSFSIVEANEYLVSVEPSSEAGKGFIIKFDKNFLTTLEEEELRAVIAHELGHIWIFTHHPYLQTEPLANEKALQLISRESLEKVYAKVWQSEGGKGSLEAFLAKVE